MFFRLKQRTAASYKCLAPYCKSNASPTYKNRVCKEHKDLPEDKIAKLTIARDNKRRKERAKNG